MLKSIKRLPSSRQRRELAKWLPGRLERLRHFWLSRKTCSRTNLWPSRVWTTKWPDWIKSEQLWQPRRRKHIGLTIVPSNSALTWCCTLIVCRKRKMKNGELAKICGSLDAKLPLISATKLSCFQQRQLTMLFKHLMVSSLTQRLGFRIWRQSLNRRRESWCVRRLSVKISKQQRCFNIASLVSPTIQRTLGRSWPSLPSSQSVKSSEWSANYNQLSTETVTWKRKAVSKSLASASSSNSKPRLIGCLRPKAPKFSRCRLRTMRTRALTLAKSRRSFLDRISRRKRKSINCWRGFNQRDHSRQVLLIKC